MSSTDERGQTSSGGWHGLGCRCEGGEAPVETALRSGGNTWRSRDPVSGHESIPGRAPKRPPRDPQETPKRRLRVPCRRAQTARHQDALGQIEEALHQQCQN